MAKPDALQGQEYDNTPNQILIDYSSLTSQGGNGWGITKLGSGDAVNSNLIQVGENLIALTRKIYGFDSIDSDNFSSDTSGYAYSQAIKQMNLILELPQKRLWRYCKECARTDLMFFRHYVDEARYFYSNSDAEAALNEAYRDMNQKLIAAGKTDFPSDHVLPATRKVETGTVGQGFFDDDFEVTMEVEQGIAGSELTESQHFNQIWGYVAQGNIPADMLKILIVNDNAISSRTRSKLLASIEELEMGQMAQYREEIERKDQAIAQLESYFNFAKQTIDVQRRRQAATERAAADQARVAGEMLRQHAQPMSESEVKSLNAKGVSGGSFSGNAQTSVYDTAE